MIQVEKALGLAVTHHVTAIRNGRADLDVFCLWLRVSLAQRLFAMALTV